MRRTIIQLLAGFISITFAFATDEKSTVEGLAPVSASVLSLALERADVAVARSVIAPNELKGAFAEGLTDRFILGSDGGPGKWNAVSARLGRQGLDHVAVRVDSEGRPKGLLVAETKYGTSQLNNNADGVQMGPKWTARRLSGIASRMRDIHAQSEEGISSRMCPKNLNKRYEVEIPITEKSSVKFWRHRMLDNEWKYDGPPELLPKAKTQLLRISDYLTAAAEDKISYRKRIFVWKAEGADLSLTIRNADRLKNGMKISSLPSEAATSIPLSERLWAEESFKKAYSNEILRKMPWYSEIQSRTTADEVFDAYRKSGVAIDLFSNKSFFRHAARQSARAGAYSLVAALPIELMLQVMSPAPLDWGRIGGLAVASGISTSAGSFSGNLATRSMLSSQFGNSLTARTAELLGVRSAGQLANLFGSGVGGGVTSAVFAYGAYFLGYYDSTTANRSAFTGAVGAASGPIAYTAALSSVAAYGTAGTGTAISTLSGAAAYNASLAALGGGSVASGGFGMAVGEVVLCTGVGVVVVGVTGAVMYGFHLYDEKQNEQRIELTLSDMRRRYANL